MAALRGPRTGPLLPRFGRSKNPHRVLVVDPSRPVRYLLARLLEDGGYGVVERSDGLAALQALKDARGEDRFDAVVFAATLPLLPTRVLLERAQPLLDGVLVLVSTGTAPSLRSEVIALEYRLRELGLRGRILEGRAVFGEVLRCLQDLRPRL